MDEILGRLRWRGLPASGDHEQSPGAQRLATPTPLDNRISYGCINVPVEFFKRVVTAAFTGTNGIVYVLPETRSARQVFASYDVDAREQIARQRVPAPGAPQFKRLSAESYAVSRRSPTGP